VAEPDGEIAESAGKPAMTRRQFLRRSALIVAGAASIDTILVEPNWLAFKTQEVPIRDLPQSFDGYRIALLSDFHIPHCITREFVAKACDMALGFHPDLIAVPGDFVHSWDFLNGRQHRLPSLQGYFDTLAAPDGVFGVLGNHDHWLDADGVRRQLEGDTPIKLIDGRHRSIERGGNVIALAGLDDLWQTNLDCAAPLRGIPPNVPRILLQHNPDLAEEMPEGCRVDLQLSGHTHGGHIRIPFGPALIIPSRYGNKFREGLVQGRRHRVYITRGVGTATPFRARLWCRPEVTGIVLRCLSPSPFEPRNP
jgi:predicted MPP superfamily phosphohydrolase